MEIIHSTDTQDTMSWEGRADTVHERAACGAEVVCHRTAVIRRDGGRLFEFFEVLLSTQVPQVGILNDNVGCEHWCCDFVAVCAIADEGVDKTFTLNGLRLY